MQVSATSLSELNCNNAERKIMAVLRRDLRLAANIVFKIVWKITLYSQIKKKCVGSLLLANDTEKITTTKFSRDIKPQTFHVLDNRRYCSSVNFNRNF